MEAVQATRVHWFRSACYRFAGVVPTPVVRFVSRTGARFPWLKRRLNWYRDTLRTRDGVIKHGVAKGLWFNTGSSNVGFFLGTSDPELQQILQMLVRPGSVVYDVGANVGFLTVVAARLTGPSGRVCAFEPFPANLKCLEHNIQLNAFDHVMAREVALADHDGTAAFLMSSNSTFGSLAGASAKVENQVGKTQVTVCRLDSIVKKDSLQLPNLMKIDVEGAEASVLDGAVETIRKARPILLIELHGTNAVISEKLSALGYFTAVVGGARSILEAHWNAQVVAFPAPCPEMERIQRGELAMS